MCQVYLFILESQSSVACVPSKMLSAVMLPNCFFSKIYARS